MENLNTKFTHKTWYKGSDLTWKEFLELASEDRSFYIDKILSKNQSDYLFDDMHYDVVLRNETGKSYVKLTEGQYQYYRQRNQFWKNWHEEFTKKNFNGVYDFSYIQAENDAKRNVKEYLEAISKLMNERNNMDNNMQRKVY